MFEWVGFIPEPRRDYPCPRPDGCICVWTQLAWGWKKGVDRQGCPVHLDQEVRAIDTPNSSPEKPASKHKKTPSTKRTAQQ
jgi:hypothetical protein